MNHATILFSATEIHAAVKRLFSEPSPNDRRVAIVAYVGTDAALYLPNPTGLRIICSPSAGGTDPNTLRHLMKRGASIEFSDALHMKVYWSQKRGCVITSANASSNALGVTGLKEAGVLFSAGEVDVDRLIKYANPRAAMSSELRKLDTVTNERERKVPRSRQPPIDFLDWYSSPHRPLWKTTWADHEVAGTAPSVKEQGLSMYGIREPHTWISIADKGAKRNDWLLCFFFSARGISQVEWKYVDLLGSKWVTANSSGFAESPAWIYLGDGDRSRPPQWK